VQRANHDYFDQKEKKMASAQTRKLIAAYYAAFNAQSVEGMLGCVGPGLIHDVSQGASRKGVRNFREFLEHMNDSYREQLSDIVIMTNTDGSRAAATFNLRGQYIKTDPGLPKARGQKYKLRGGTFFEIQSSKITRISTHYNLADWKKQVLAG
jgi:steroid delta-isomerase-like uncharacterized protein